MSKLTSLLVGLMVLAFSQLQAQTCTADAGTLSNAHGVQFFSGPGDTIELTATPNGDEVIPAGYAKIYVLTSGRALRIQAVNTTPSFKVGSTGLFTIHTLVYNPDPNSPDFLDLSIVEFGVTTGVDVLNLVIANNICASLDVPGAPTAIKHCRANAGTLTADSTVVPLQGGGVVISATPDGNDNTPRNYSKLFVLTSGPNLVIEQVSATPSFTVTQTGLYTIHTLIYDGRAGSPDFLDLSVVQFGTTTGGDVLGLVGSNFLCADLDVAGAPINVTTCPAFAGTLSPENTVITTPVLTGTGDSARIAAVPNGDENIPAGYTKIFVLTSGANLVIENVSTTPEFFVKDPGLYTIHTLVFNPDTTQLDGLDLSVVQLGVTTGVDVVNLIASAGICADLDVAGVQFNVGTCAADAGTLTATADSAMLMGGEATISATPNGDENVPAGYSKIFVLTSGTDLVIEQVSADPEFTVNLPGLYTIHTLVFDGRMDSEDFLDLSIVQFGSTTGVDVLGIVTAAKICASLDVPGAPVTVTGCGADAGTLSPESHQIAFTFLTGTNDSSRLAAVQNGDEVIPPGYSKIFVLTSGADLTIEAVSATPEFFVKETGIYTIHTLIYNADPNSPDFLDLSVVQFGVTTGVDVLNLVTSAGICASLDVPGTRFVVKDCRADAGTLTADASTVTLNPNGTIISATPDGNVTVPRGFSSIFVLTSGAGLVIEQVSATPEFTVTSAGLYTIHTLVYDGDPVSQDFLDLSVVQFGVTTGVDVLGIVAGNALCADLDVAGAPINVEACTADAGTLSPENAVIANPVLTGMGDSARLAATPNGDEVIPAGYSKLFVLTSGTGLVIENVSTSPEFFVKAPGLYTIHTLIYNADPNSPNFLDLSVVQLGVTTGVDVLNIVTSAGICASLDVAGTQFNVGECAADAGTLTADASPVMLMAGQATISATPNGDINVPADYSQIFVLTSGANLVIEQVGTSPEFTVTDPGLYTIHTLVYDGRTDSEDFLDLSIVQFGSTTGGDVLGIVVAAQICASLDVAGAPITVTGCEADAGTLSPENAVIANPVLTGMGDSVRLAATPNGDENIPAGYSKLFVLTSGAGLVIENVSTNPEFFVKAPGLYTIHTLIYNADPNSPDFLDLSVVQFGVTTGVDVLNIVTSAGICADLDVAGTQFNVGECAADAGTLTADATMAELMNGEAMISATPNGDINVPAGYSQIFVLTSGTNLVIEQVGANPSFTVTAPGLYTIHTLVYDGRTDSEDFLDLSIVQLGSTTGGDVLGIVIAAQICASLDVAGAPVTVTEPVCTADAGTLSRASGIDRFPVLSGAGDSVRLAAVPNGDEVVPAGYSKLFVLTSGRSLTIQQVSTTPEFFVKRAGISTIHTLIYNADPNSPDFLDLSVVQVGVTTGVDVLNLVTSAGICASLDVAGERFVVRHCRAEAGTLTANHPRVRIRNGRAVLEATPNGDENVPHGYTKLYVLTSGSGLVIENVNTQPVFHVSDPGLYTIHTLVFVDDPNSPEFLDLSIVQPGVTTGVDVLGIITGNLLCADLDVPGAPITVRPANHRLALTDNVSIYPNPATSVLKVEANTAAEVAYRMVDINGKTVAEGTLDFNQGRIQTLAVDNLSEGIYQLVMTDLASGETVIEKVTKR